MPAAGRPHLLCLCSTSIVRHLWMKPSDLKEGIPLTSQSLTLLNLNGVHNLVNFINLSTFDVNWPNQKSLGCVCRKKKLLIQHRTMIHDSALPVIIHFFSRAHEEKNIPVHTNSFSLFIDTLWEGGGQLNYHAWFFPRIILQHNDLKK